MFKKQIEQIKNFFSADGENDKKKIENLVFLLILLIITIIAINFIWNGNKGEEKKANTTTQLVSTEKIENKDMNSYNDEYNLQSSLKNILAKISGAGHVEVLLTYTQTSELVPIYNEIVKESITEERDTEGGTRTIEQKDNNKEVVYTEESGGKLPITQKIIMPQVEGAVILAEGATNAEVKNNIIQAVEAVTGLSVHKIQVFKLDTNINGR